MSKLTDFFTILLKKRGGDTLVKSKGFYYYKNREKIY